MQNFYQPSGTHKISQRNCVRWAPTCATKMLSNRLPKLMSHRLLENVNSIILKKKIRNQRIKDLFEKREKYPTQNLNTFFWRIDVFSSVHITTLCRPSLSLSECYLFSLNPFTYNYLSQMWKQPEDPWVHHWLSEYILHTTSKHLSISYILYTPVSDLYSKHSNAQGATICLFVCFTQFCYVS